MMFYCVLFYVYDLLLLAPREFLCRWYVFMGAERLLSLSLILTGDELGQKVCWLWFL